VRDAEEARDIRAAERLRLWEQHGCARLIEYLEVKCGIEPRTAIDRIRVARALEELPLVEAALEEGGYSHSAVRELVRVVRADTEEEWVEYTRGMTYREVREAVAGHAPGDRPSDETKPDERLRTFTALLKPSTIARFEAMAARIERERGDRFVDDDDKFTTICDAAENGGGESVPAEVWLIDGERGLENRRELGEEELEAVLCDATMMGHVDDPHARAQPMVSPRKRKRLFARDGNQCTVPGCRSKLHLDLHHIKHRKDGGGDEDPNLLTICGGHHRLHHRGRLRISGHAPDKLVFERVSTVPPERR